MSTDEDNGLKDEVAAVLDRWPSAGLAAGVVRGGTLAWFLGHGVADARTMAPVRQDTVFRIGSITKTFTAIAVMQFARSVPSARTDWRFSSSAAPMLAISPDVQLAIALSPL